MKTSIAYSFYPWKNVLWSDNKCLYTTWTSAFDLIEREKMQQIKQKHAAKNKSNINVYTSI